MASPRFGGIGGIPPMIPVTNQVTSDDLERMFAEQDLKMARMFAENNAQLAAALNEARADADDAASISTEASGLTSRSFRSGRSARSARSGRSGRLDRTKPWLVGRPFWEYTQMVLVAFIIYSAMTQLKPTAWDEYKAHWDSALAPTAGYKSCQKTVTVIVPAADYGPPDTSHCERFAFADTMEPHLKATSCKIAFANDGSWVGAAYYDCANGKSEDDIVTVVDHACATHTTSPNTAELTYEECDCVWNQFITHTQAQVYFWIIYGPLAFSAAFFSFLFIWMIWVAVFARPAGCCFCEIMAARCDFTFLLFWRSQEEQEGGVGN